MSNTNKVAKVQESNFPLFLFHQGTNFKAYEYLGAHFVTEGGIDGVIFRTWAPKAEEVSVVGDFNEWNAKANVMKRISDGGVYELFIPGLKEYDAYKFAVTSNYATKFKADPYAFHAEDKGTASKIYNLEGYEWKDTDFVSKRSTFYDKPVNIYEVNLASWKKKDDGQFLSYVELASELVKYVSEMGYTHVEFMPITEYPFDGSWGYQVTGYFAITSRFGTPKDFMYLIDEFHKHGIGVIVDWVPAHFPKDGHGLYEFDGYPCYENQGWDRQEHKTWGTRIFDWGRNEVQSFLISSAEFLFEKFHIDGIRVDAVASMLYLDYDRRPGEWIPNENGGNYNLQAISFLQKLNVEIFTRFPYALMMAEESTAFPMITKPVDVGGLGFNFKWNMGWMNDVLSYMQCDPYFRSGNHNKLTFSMYYAFSENFVLPISHDEVVHGKKSMIDKMPGDLNEKFANLRTFSSYMFAHPGKKLNFMGSEFGQFVEWNYKEGLEFFMLKYDLHKKLRNFNIKLNEIYKNYSALYEIEDSWGGFEWISADEKDNNVISFKRRDKKGNEIIFIANFSGNTYLKYRLGVDPGSYKILLTTDDKRFGGEGLIAKKVYKSSKKPAHGKSNSILMNLQKFSGTYFVLDK